MAITTPTRVITVDTWGTNPDLDGTADRHHAAQQQHAADGASRHG
jgi:hypothetical protein